ncbi:unnamed protein product [Didymodactylos carnosus]|uniref:Beta-lactamase-related domain-containing protein n=1 Tax=Didymodactylos carnosus TaxID=1234261 RepID=A0A814D7I7_9BILA|nr:unnamed protein product [Didymodactylos carnosus]CAF1102467.1 unnamed protein product [Didymodactylos carnosus]CAF3725663.1 unnamed protein product [Didymodactylos carnosus]CAF3863691.1 unnamed protein product [Didymodactylos carnosus]
MTTAREAGGICTNVEDFYRWLEAVFNPLTTPTKFIEPYLFKQMITPSPVSKKNNEHGWYGYGYGLIVNEYGNVIEHSGEIYGFESGFKRLVKEQINIIVFSNIFECQVKLFVDFIHSVLVGREVNSEKEEKKGGFAVMTYKKFRNKFLG